MGYLAYFKTSRREEYLALIEESKARRVNGFLNIRQPVFEDIITSQPHTQQADVCTPIDLRQSVPRRTPTGIKKEAKPTSDKKFINSFMLFSKVHRPIANELTRGVDNRKVSTQLSQWWNAAEPSLRKQYTDLSTTLRQIPDAQEKERMLAQSLPTMPLFDYSNLEQVQLDQSLAQDQVIALRAESSKRKELSHTEKKKELIVQLLKQSLYPDKSQFKMLMRDRLFEDMTYQSVKILIRATRQQLVSKINQK